MEWTVVVVISVLVGIVGKFASESAKLAAAMAKNTTATETLSGQFGDFTAQNREEHEKMRDKLEGHGEKLENHEGRISALEREGKEG